MDDNSTPIDLDLNPDMITTQNVVPSLASSAPAPSEPSGVIDITPESSSVSTAPLSTTTVSGPIVSDIPSITSTPSPITHLADLTPVSETSTAPGITELLPMPSSSDTSISEPTPANISQQSSELPNPSLATSPVLTPPTATPLQTVVNPLVEDPDLVTLPK